MTTKMGGRRYYIYNWRTMKISIVTVAYNRVISVTTDNLTFLHREPYTVHKILFKAFLCKILAIYLVTFGAHTSSQCVIMQ